MLSTVENTIRFAGDVAVAIRCMAVTDEICANFTERGQLHLSLSLSNI
jgi:hypothetical protein